MPKRKTSPRPKPMLAETDTDAVEDSAVVKATLDDVGFDFSELFGDGSDAVKVELYRISPQYYESHRVDGYVDDVIPGQGIGELRRLHGGGHYRLLMRKNGKITGQRYVRISGPPRFVPPASEPSAGTDVEPEPSPAGQVEPVVMEIGGVKIPVTADVAELQRMVMWVKMLQQLFPPIPDINETLLSIALGRDGKQPDMLEQADRFSALAERLHNIVGGQPTGTDLPSLALQALQTLNKMLDQRSKRQPLGVVEKPALPDVTPTEKEPEADKEPPPEPVATPAGEPLQTAQTVAEKAGSYVVQGFLMEPQQTPEQTAQVLTAVLPDLTAEQKAELPAYQNLLRMVARSILGDQVEADSELFKKFDLYFDNTFSIFSHTEDQKPSTEGNSID